MRRECRAILIAVLIAVALPAWAMQPPKRAPAPPPQTLPADEPAFRITPPASYTAKRIALFPLEIPGYMLKALLWPVGSTLEWMERNHYSDRVQDAISFKSHKIWIYPVVDKSPGTSFGGGVAVKVIDLFQKGDNINADYRVHVNLDMFADVSFRKDELFHIGGVPVALAFKGNWAKRGSFNFFGVGNNSLESNQSSWAENDLDATVRFGLKPIHTLSLYAILGGSATSTGNASTQGIDPANNPPRGYGRWLQYIRMGGGITHDTRDVTWNPRRGGIHSLEVSRFQYMGTGGNFSYNDYRLLLNQYIPLWSPDHTLMLRNYWWLEQQSSGGLPVPRMTVLDADNWLRGFDQGRFRDRSSVVFNAEYYFPLFRRVRGMMLVDYGRVFNGLSNFTFKDFKYSAGGGFDIELTRVIIARFRAAYGGEGVKFLLTLLRKQP
ncbi:MAG: BamA/TamA family outer membrane protein [bacterium]